MITQGMEMSHVKWDCKYHVVITPKYRKKILYGQIKESLGKIIRELARQRGIEIIEGHLCIDHIHMVIKVPPKYSISMTIGFIKGKSAIRLHQEFGRKYRNYYGKHFWSRGYYVSTIGLDAKAVIEYVRDQEKKDKNIEGEQIDMGW